MRESDERGRHTKGRTLRKEKYVGNIEERKEDKNDGKEEE